VSDITTHCLHVQFIDNRENNQYLQDNKGQRLHSTEMTLNVDFLK